MSKLAKYRLRELWKDRKFRSGESGQSLSVDAKFAWWLCTRIWGWYRTEWEILSAGTKIDELLCWHMIYLYPGGLDWRHMNQREIWWIWTLTPCCCEKTIFSGHNNTILRVWLCMWVDISRIWFECARCSRVFGYSGFSTSTARKEVFHLRCHWDMSNWMCDAIRFRGHLMAPDWKCNLKELGA
jgi:hypothetical protein